jgi:hypothetical protein
MPPTMLQFRSVVKVPSQSQDLSKVQKCSGGVYHPECEIAPNIRFQPTPTHAPFGRGTWRGRHLGRLAILERG